MFMETGYDEALKLYYSQFESHVQPDFLAHPGVEELLRSDLALRRFVPKEWTGLVGDWGKLSLEFKDTFPDSHRVSSRPINPRLFEHAKKEFERLKTYLYEPSTSPWASPLVIAPKATTPFIRFCGDYTWLNKHVVQPQLVIPNVKHEIEKACACGLFIDNDLTNSYHQIPLEEMTKKRLAIQTTWGLVQPRF
jgi:hypothetical protein